MPPSLAAAEGRGLGEVVGREIERAKLKYREASIFASAYEAGIPATVHVTLGADIIHMHPKADGAAIGAASFADFHQLAAMVAGLIARSRAQPRIGGGDARGVPESAQSCAKPGP